mmetsp:Transcript_3320/g.12035  ORF Transcript_3320/g.12035 Transcript_3320/m.12035 type:complete len:430 (+) Transcript_3320:598-1887(+)
MGDCCGERGGFRAADERQHQLGWSAVSVADVGGCVAVGAGGPSGGCGRRCWRRHQAAQQQRQQHRQCLAPLAAAWPRALPLRVGARRGRIRTRPALQAPPHGQRLCRQGHGEALHPQGGQGGVRDERKAHPVRQQPPEHRQAALHLPRCAVPVHGYGAVPRRRAAARHPQEGGRQPRVQRGHERRAHALLPRAGRQRAQLPARAPHRAPRPEAGEHPDRRHRARQDHRLWHREGRGQPRPEARQRLCGHGRVRGAGGATRQARGARGGPVGAGLHPVRVSAGEARVRRGQRVPHLPAGPQLPRLARARLPRLLPGGRQEARAEPHDGGAERAAGRRRAGQRQRHGGAARASLLGRQLRRAAARRAALHPLDAGAARAARGRRGLVRGRGADGAQALAARVGARDPRRGRDGAAEGGDGWRRRRRRGHAE